MRPVSHQNGTSKPPQNRALALRSSPFRRSKRFAQK